MVNKRTLIQRIIEQLAGGLDVYARAARSAHAEATHEQSKAENKYDTRGLEASYLARGQSRQVAEVAQAIREFESLPVRGFAKADPIDVGAVVELEGKGGRAVYFLAPRAGGTEIKIGKREVLVITPQSPLGQQLSGRRQGDCLLLEIAGERLEYRIAKVS